MVFPGGRRRARKRLEALRIEVAQRRGVAVTSVHIDAASFAQDRRIGTVLLDSQGQIVDSFGGRISDWPPTAIASRSLWDEAFELDERD